jgi:hypothetical protein
MHIKQLIDSKRTLYGKKLASLGWLPYKICLFFNSFLITFVCKVEILVRKKLYLALNALKLIGWALLVY